MPTISNAAVRKSMYFVYSDFTESDPMRKSIEFDIYIEDFLKMTDPSCCLIAV